MTELYRRYRMMNKASARYAPRSPQAALAIAFLAVAAGCYASNENTLGGESHFLRSCDSKCGQNLSCICGVCTKICETNQSCVDLPGNPSCVSPDELDATRQCEGGDPADEPVCDVSCDRKSDCEVLATAATCTRGFCREPSQSVSDGGQMPDAKGSSDAGPDYIDAGSAVDGEAEPTAVTKPLLMILVDTSGSMELLPNCTCTTEACDECLPSCTDDPDTDQKNRWAVVLEALTGVWESFQCTATSRESDYFTFDRGYSIPYHYPPVWSAQSADGILDTHVSDLRFGLATFDSQPTYLGADPLVMKSEFDFSSSASEQGLWSYGPYSTAGYPHARADGSVTGKLLFPGCTDAFVIDTGIKSRQAEQGALLAALNQDEMKMVNGRIQTSLLNIRPYGGTPTAAALDDIKYFFENDYDTATDGSSSSSSSSSAAARYLLLITDGRPDDDFRDSSRCDCASETECCETLENVESGNLDCSPEEIQRRKEAGEMPEGDDDAYNPDVFQCPYPTPEQVAAALLNGYDGEGGVISKLFVVGLSAPCNGANPGEPDYDPDHETEGCQIRDTLDKIAQAGGSPAALFSRDRQELRDRIEAIISEIISG